MEKSRTIKLHKPNIMCLTCHWIQWISFQIIYFFNDMYSMTYSQLHAILRRHSTFIPCNFLCKKILSILPGKFCRRINRNLWKQPTISASHCCFWIFATGNHSADSENITFNTVKKTIPARVLFITLCGILKRKKKKKQFFSWAQLF